MFFHYKHQKCLRKLSGSADYMKHVYLEMCVGSLRNCNCCWNSKQYLSYFQENFAKLVLKEIGGTKYTTPILNMIMVGLLQSEKKTYM